MQGIPSQQTHPDDVGNLVEFIINLPLFEFLSKNDLFEVASRMEYIDLVEGDALFREWDKADFACFVESGELEVTKKTGRLISGRRSSRIVFNSEWQICSYISSNNSG